MLLGGRYKKATAELQKVLVAEAEAQLLTIMTNHNAPDFLTQCVARSLSTMLPDSEIAKHMTLGRTKASKTLINTLAPHLHEEVVTAMQSWPYSISFDESTINKTSQLGINVSYRNKEGHIRKLPSLP